MFDIPNKKIKKKNNKHTQKIKYKINNTLDNNNLENIDLINKKFIEEYNRLQKETSPNVYNDLLYTLPTKLIIDYYKYCDELYCDELYCDELYCDELYCDELYCDELYCDELYCDELYCDELILIHKK